MKSQIRSILAITLLASSAVTALAAPAPEPPSRPLPLPGGVADPDGKTGYVVNEKGGINALDLESGKILWTRDEPAKPFAPMPHELRLVLAATGLFNLLFFVYPGPLIAAATVAAKSLF